MLIAKRTNDALNINPLPGIREELSVNGSNWLWTCFTIFLVFLLGLLALSYRPRCNEKIFHYLLTIALFVGSITYFANASNLGWFLVTQADSDGAPRQIFFAKYVYWVVAFPVVNILLGLVANSSWATIIWHVFFSWIWVISYLVSALTSSDYKWGFFTFGTLAYLAMAASTMNEGRTGARRVGTQRDYWILSAYFILLWFLYPIAFGVSEGGNHIGVSPHFIFFGLLDLMMMPLGAVLFLVLSRQWDYNVLNLYFTQYGRVAQGGHYPEKSPAPVPGPAATPVPTATPADVQPV